jgi:hypothetical protein
MNLRERVRAAIGRRLAGRLDRFREAEWSDDIADAVIDAIQPDYCYLPASGEWPLPWEDLDDVLVDWPYDEVVEIGVLAALPNRFAVSLSNPPEGAKRTQTFATLDEAEAAAAASRALD